MTQRCDVLVLGGGPEGLSAAILLAQSGKKVHLICEQAVLGGLGAEVSFGEGFRAPGVLHDSHRVRPRVVKALGLEQHGLSWRARPPLFGPELDGPGLLLPTEPSEMARAIGARNGEVGGGFSGYRGYLDRIRPALRAMMDNPAPSLQTEAALWPLLKSGLSLRRLGKRDMMELLRVAPSCVDDWLSEHFEDPLVRALLAGPALTGSWMGPLSPTSTFCLLVDDALSGSEVVGGPAGLCRALKAAAEAAGVTFSHGKRINALLHENNRVTGAALEDNTHIEAKATLSTLGPKRTCLDLLEPGLLSPSIESEISNIRTRGMIAKVHLGIRGELRFNGHPDGRFERIWVGPHPHDYERAFDDVRLREMPRRPVLDIRVPTLADPSLAPEGHHVLSVLVHGAGQTLKGGWSDEAREVLLHNTLSTLEDYAPGISAQVTAQQVMTPADLSDAFGLPDGHIFHGEVAVDQMWALRPSMRSSGHHVGVDGLWLGSTGAHGGGALSCAAGAFAAGKLGAR